MWLVGPPSAATLKISDPLARARQNAIYRASGDQAGKSSGPCVVSLSGLTAYATGLPSGDKLGLVCMPDSAVSRVVFRPVVGVDVRFHHHRPAAPVRRIA